MAQIPIRMPKMSMTMTEGEVSEWFVGIGDTVAEGDVICEVLTDKVDMEVESPAAGVISSIVVESGSVDVGTPIGYIEGDDSGGFGDMFDSIGQDAPAAVEPEGAPEPEPVARVSDSPVPAVPRARTLAREHGIELRDVVGSGPDGLVVMADVESAVAAQRQSAIPATAASVTPPAGPLATPVATPATAPVSAPVAAPVPTPAPVVTPAKAPSAKRVALVRARVAAKMTESAGVPQFTVWRELTLDAANRHRHGVSWTTVLLSAYASALRQVPELLCRWDGTAAVPSGPPSIGLAIDTAHGLLAPVLVAPDDEAASELDQRVRQLVATAQQGKVDPAYLQVANGMVSNLGGLGVDRFQALVTPPQASVLSVGSIKQRPVAVTGGLGSALTVIVGLTVDHRVADGAHGARLLAAVADNVSHWGETDTPHS